MQTIFMGKGPVFEAANAAYAVLFEGAGVSKTLSRARHMLIDEYRLSPEEAAGIVHLVKNTVFDPMAAPGANPATDRNVKDHMALFPTITDYVATRIVGSLGGLNDLSRQRTSHLGEAIRAYLKANPGASVDFDRLSQLDRALTVGNRGSVEGGYQAIPVKSSEELNAILSKLGADDVHWCIRGETPWKSYSDNGKNDFYLLYDGSRPGNGNMSIVGAFVTPGGRVANSFDRANRAVKFGDTTNLLKSAGIPVADFGNLASVLADGLYDIADVADDYTEIDHNKFLIKDNAAGKSNVVIYRDGKYVPVMPDWVDDKSLGIIYEGYDPLFITDGKRVYGLEEPYGLRAVVPDGLTAETEFADDDSPVIFVARDGRRVNILDLDSGDLLLDQANDIPFTDTKFWSTWDSKNQRFSEFATTDFHPPSYWILIDDNRDGPSKAYAVTERGKKLSDCPAVDIPEDYSLENLSGNGKFYSLRKRRGYADDADYGRYVLMSDGKAVLPGSYRYIDDNGDGTWFIYDSSEPHEPYYVLDCGTGKIDRKQD